MNNILQTFALATGGTTGAVFVLLAIVWTLKKVQDVLGNITKLLIKLALILLAITLGVGVFNLF